MYPAWMNAHWQKQFDIGKNIYNLIICEVYDAIIWTVIVHHLECVKHWARWYCIIADNKEAFPNQRYNSATIPDISH